MKRRKNVEVVVVVVGVEVVVGVLVGGEGGI